MPSDSRNSKNSRKTSSGSNRSATVVTGARCPVDHAPAMSQLPMCGTKITAERPASRFARTAASLTARHIRSRSSWVQSGSRNASQK